MWPNRSKVCTNLIGLKPTSQVTSPQTAQWPPTLGWSSTPGFPGPAVPGYIAWPLQWWFRHPPGIQGIKTKQHPVAATSLQPPFCNPQISKESEVSPSLAPTTISTNGSSGHFLPALVWTKAAGSSLRSSSYLGVFWKFQHGATL